MPVHPIHVHTKVKKTVEVVLTVPHNTCIDNSKLSKLTFDESFEKSKKIVHMCDFIAASAAKLIKKFLGLLNTTVFIGKVYRDRCERCDLNRFNRKTGFRPKLTKYLKKNRAKKKLFVLDVHSFPPNMERRKMEKLKDLDCFVLDDSNPIKNYSTEFVKFMIKNKVKTKVIKGSNNDIMDESRELGIPSFLLEFNEKLFKDENRLIFICKKVAEWLKKEKF